MRARFAAECEYDGPPGLSDVFDVDFAARIFNITVVSPFVVLADTGLDLPGHLSLPFEGGWWLGVKVMVIKRIIISLILFLSLLRVKCIQRKVFGF